MPMLNWRSNRQASASPQYKRAQSRRSSQQGASGVWSGYKQDSSDSGPFTLTGWGSTQRELPQYQPASPSPFRPGQAQPIQRPYDYSTPYGFDEMRPRDLPATPSSEALPRAPGGAPDVKAAVQPGPPSYKAAYEQAISDPTSKELNWEWLNRMPGYVSSGYMSPTDGAMLNVLKKAGKLEGVNTDNLSKGQLNELYRFHGGVISSGLKGTSYFLE